MKEEALLVKKSEIRRYHVINSVIEKQIKINEAAKDLKITIRQVRNIVRRVKQEGEKGIIHKSRGQESRKKIPQNIENMIVKLAEDKYGGFNPTFLTEKLNEDEGITVSKESVRKILIKAGIHKPKPAKQKHRQWRERRHCKGELVQIDGSIHNWFGDKKCWLIASIDDATGDVYLMFAKSESTEELMRFMNEYIKKFGCPVAIYVDKDSIYKVARAQTTEEQLEDNKPTTQFMRAMEELGIEIIYANSPQAKGRIERSFATHQDRLVKELKLKNITTIEEANEYLKKEYISKHNNKFSVEPVSKDDMHIKLPKYADLDSILSIKNDRKISNDYTVRYKGRVFQLLEIQKCNILTRNKVVVEERLDKSIHLSYKGVYVNYKEITEKFNRHKTKKINVLTPKEISQIKTIAEYFKNENSKPENPFCQVPLSTSVPVCQGNPSGSASLRP